MKNSIDASTIWDYSFYHYHGWMFSNFSSDTWTKTTTPELYAEIGINVVYMRKILSFEINNRSSVYLRISHVSGIIFYINGVKMYEKFIEYNIIYLVHIQKKVMQCLVLMILQI